MLNLAELNIAKLRYPKGDPQVEEFFDALDRVNGLAERMPGFVWRLKDEGGNATDIPFCDDPMVIANLSVWETAEALEKYVFQTVHTAFYRKRDLWFERMAGPHMVFWWVEPGTAPTLANAAARLTDLASNGPSARAFGWADLKSAELWRAQRCG
jgi:heme-degrading monooxygenase HmoA